VLETRRVCPIRSLIVISIGIMRSSALHATTSDVLTPPRHRARQSTAFFCSLLGGLVEQAAEQQIEYIVGIPSSGASIRSSTPPIQSELPTQPFDLSHARAQLLGRLDLCQPPLQQAPKNLQSVQLSGTHRQGSLFVHVDLQARHNGAWKPTFLMVRNPTFLHCVYICTTGNYGYDNPASNGAYSPRSRRPAWTTTRHRVASRSRQAGEERSQRTRLAVGALGLIVATLIAYAPALRAGFIWDDDAYVSENQTLRSGDGLRKIWFELGATPQYYPLVFTTFWAEYQIWEARPTGYHLINVLLHALSAVLLWRLLRLLGVPGAWIGAAVFALHPVNVESVAWISERKNVLSGMFYLSSALAYFHFDARLLSTDAGRARIYALSLFLFLCALLSKTVTATLPAALLLVIWWKRGRVRWRDFQRVLPFFVLGMVFGLVTAWTERIHVGATGASWNFGPLDRVLIAGRAVWFYASKLVWPNELTFIYPHWRIDSQIWWQFLFPVAALALLAALWFLRGRIGRGPLVAALFFGGTLVPALGFFNVYPMRYSFVADHFQYLAGIGLITLAVAAGTSAIAKFDDDRKRMTAIVAALVLLVLGTLTWQQARICTDLRGSGDALAGHATEEPASLDGARQSRELVLLTGKTQRGFYALRLRTGGAPATGRPANYDRCSPRSGGTLR